MSLDSVSINLQKDSKIIGNIIFDQIAGLEEVLVYISQLIDNYNQHLIGHVISKKLDDTVCAHRFFDLEKGKDLYFNLHRHIENNSYKYARENFPDVSWPSEEEQCLLGRIALIKPEMDLNNEEAKHQVVVNLDDKTICLSTLFYLQEIDEYKKEHGLNEKDDIDILLLDYNPRIIYFNQLDERLNYVNSYDAFQTNSIKKYESVYVPI